MWKVVTNNSEIKKTSILIKTIRVSKKAYEFTISNNERRIGALNV